jgi:hypothetical protein
MHSTPSHLRRGRHPSFPGCQFINDLLAADQRRRGMATLGRMSGDEADMTALSLRPTEVARPNRNAANTRDELVIHQRRTSDPTLAPM